MLILLPVEIKSKNTFIRKTSIVLGTILVIIAYIVYQTMYADSLALVFSLLALVFVLPAIGMNETWAIVSQQSIQLRNKPFRALGEIYWRDITEFKEIAHGVNGRTFRFFVKDPTVYINNVSNIAAQKTLKKTCANNGDALFIFKTNNLEYDIASLRETFTHLINTK